MTQQSIVQRALVPMGVATALVQALTFYVAFRPAPELLAMTLAIVAVYSVLGIFLGAWNAITGNRPR